MGILKKLLLLIGATLVTAFIVVGLIFYFGMQSNTGQHGQCPGVEADE